MPFYNCLQLRPTTHTPTSNRQERLKYKLLQVFFQLFVLVPLIRSITRSFVTNRTVVRNPHDKGSPTPHSRKTTLELTVGSPKGVRKVHLHLKRGLKDRPTRSAARDPPRPKCMWKKGRLSSFDGFCLGPRFTVWGRVEMTPGSEMEKFNPETLLRHVSWLRVSGR